MEKPTVRLDNLRIASPCPVRWEQMTGDERVRRCDLCELHVYNISRMTRREAESLLANSEGRICARLFRRSDGTVITRDCPVGLRAIRRRAAKTAGAVFAAIMTVCAAVAGQNPPRKSKNSCASRINISRRVSNLPQETGSITLKILDINGAVVAGADVTISESIAQPPRANATTRSWHRTSDDEGRIELGGLANGIYDLKIEQPGFKISIVTDVSLAAREVVAVEVTLEVLDGSVTIGIVAEPSLIETPAGTTIFSEQIIQRLPHQK